MQGTVESTQGWVEFVPVTPEPTDRIVETAGSLGVSTELEPFGTDLAIRLPEMAKGDSVDTSKFTGPKGGGNYDDYHTQSE